MSYTIRALLIFLTLSVLNSCESQSENVNPTSQLQKIKDSNELKVGTLYNPLSYYYGSNENPTGFDYELAQQFAEYLGVKLKIAARYSPTELRALLDNDNLDLIASTFNTNQSRNPSIKLSPEIHQVDQIIVYRTGSFRPKNIPLIDGDVWVVSGSPQEELLKQLSEKYPDLPWKSTTSADEEELLRKVANEEIKYALVDSANLSLNQLFYPILAKAIIVRRAVSSHWQLKSYNEDSLQAALISFIALQYQSGDLDKLKEKYFGHFTQFGRFDYVDTRQFLRAIKTRLPKFEALFRQYAGDLDWRLLASMSYQESHWRPLATSPTGVRGLMMLTNRTAKAMGIKNRLDPEQSIKGGVKYLKKLLARLPKTIPQDERIWFALAAYNLGYGHVMDARRLTVKRGKSADSWGEVKETLPLLMQRRWNKKTRYGYARGAEAASYVLNIRQYYQSLAWKDDIIEKQKDLEAQNAKFKKLIPALDLEHQVVPASISNPIENIAEPAVSSAVSIIKNNE